MLTSTQLLDRAAAAQDVQSASSLSQLNEDYTNFLTLLTAQISNQDPLSPIDSTQFVSQLAQLSQVEQTVRMNGELEDLNGRLNAVMNLAGTELLGRDVSIETDMALLAVGEINSQYVLPEGVAEVSARFFDSAGIPVRTLTGLPTDAGLPLPLEWDGRNDTGVSLNEGAYRVELTALNNLGEKMEFELFRDGVVQEVLFRNGEVRFTMEDGVEVSSVTLRSAK